MVEGESILRKMIERKTADLSIRDRQNVSNVFMRAYVKLTYAGILSSYYDNKKEAFNAIIDNITVEELENVLKERFSEESKYDNDPAIAVNWARVALNIEKAFNISFDYYNIGIFKERKVLCSCGAECFLEKAVRGKRKGNILWTCPLCGASVGVHPGTNIPLGIPASKDVGVARIAVHNEINRLVESGLTKNGVYKILSRKMNLKPEDTHAGKFNKEQCEQAFKILKEIKGGFKY